MALLISIFVIFAVSLIILIKFWPWRRKVLAVEKKDRDRLIKHVTHPKLANFSSRKAPDEPTKLSSDTVWFNYNGHSWNALEVLETDLEANDEQLALAYAEALEKVDRASREFIDAAYKAIRQRK